MFNVLYLEIKFLCIKLNDGYDHANENNIMMVMIMVIDDSYNGYDEGDED